MLRQLDFQLMCSFISGDRVSMMHLGLIVENAETNEICSKSMPSRYLGSVSGDAGAGSEDQKEDKHLDWSDRAKSSHRNGTFQRGTM
jgi:hypothetical protein